MNRFDYTCTERCFWWCAFKAEADWSLTLISRTPSFRWLYIKNALMFNAKAMPPMTVRTKWTLPQWSILSFIQASSFLRAPWNSKCGCKVENYLLPDNLDTQCSLNYISSDFLQIFFSFSIEIVLEIETIFEKILKANIYKGIQINWS